MKGNIFYTQEGFFLSSYTNDVWGPVGFFETREEAVFALLCEFSGCYKGGISLEIHPCVKVVENDYERTIEAEFPILSVSCKGEDFEITLEPEWFEGSWVSRGWIRKSIQKIIHPDIRKDVEFLLSPEGYHCVHYYTPKGVMVANRVSSEDEEFKFVYGMKGKDYGHFEGNITDVLLWVFEEVVA